MNFILNLIVLISCYCLFNCEEKFMFETADLIVESKNGRLEGFRSSAKNNESKPDELRWACLGKAKLIKENESNSYFQFNLDGFFVYIDFSLSNENRELLVGKAREKYSSPNIVKTQIIDIPLTGITCKLESIDSTIRLNLMGNVTSSLRKMPVALYFSAPLNSNERKFLKKKVTLDKVVLRCEIELNDEISSQFSLSVNNKNHQFMSDSDKNFNEIEKSKLRTTIEILKLKEALENSRMKEKGNFFNVFF